MKLEYLSRKRINRYVYTCLANGKLRVSVPAFIHDARILIHRYDGLEVLDVPVSHNQTVYSLDISPFSAGFYTLVVGNPIEGYISQTITL